MVVVLALGAYFVTKGAEMRVGDVDVLLSVFAPASSIGRLDQISACINQTVATGPRASWRDLPDGRCPPPTVKGARKRCRS